MINRAYLQMKMTTVQFVFKGESKLHVFKT